VEQKLEKILNFLCPTDGKTTNGFKSFVLNKVLSRPWPAAGQARRTMRLIRWPFFNPLEIFLKFF